MGRRKKIPNYWASIFGVTPKTKRKNTLSTKYKTVSKKRIQKIKPLPPLTQGLHDALSLTSKWNSQPNPPKVYIGGYRIHHGFVGSLVIIYGLLTENQYAIGMGAGLAIDDISDMPHWLDFEKQPSNNFALPQLYHNNLDRNFV